MVHNSINLDLATNYYLCECLMTFDSSQHCIEHFLFLVKLNIVISCSINIVIDSLAKFTGIIGHNFEHNW